MNKTTYTIIKDNITIGRFENKNDRDNAFSEFVLPFSNNCLKGETNG